MSKVTRSFVIDTSRSVAATGVTPSIEVARDDGYTLQTVFTGLATGASGTLTLQTSIDGTNFANYTSGNQNFASGTSNLMWEVPTKRHKYLRLSLSGVVASGTGTCTTTYYGEVLAD
jgi:hypothetical protein